MNVQVQRCKTSLVIGHARQRWARKHTAHGHMPALHALPHQLCRCLSSALAHLANTLWPHRVLLKRIENQGKAVIVSLLPTCTRCALTSWQEAGQRLQTTATCSLADHCECLKTKGHGCRGRYIHDAPGYKPGKYLMICVLHVTHVLLVRARHDICFPVITLSNQTITGNALQVVESTHFYHRVIYAFGPGLGTKSSVLPVPKSMSLSL